MKLCEYQELTDVVFDFDGVLIDSNTAKRFAFATTACAFAKNPLHFKNFDANFGNDGRHRIIQRNLFTLENCYEIPVSESQFNSAYETVLASILTTVNKPFQLDRLRSFNPKCDWHIVSASSESWLLSFVKDHYHQYVFKSVRGSPLSKREILAEAALPPKSTLLIGDRCDDRLVAEGFGFKAVLVTAWSNCDIVSGMCPDGALVWRSLDDFILSLR